MAQYRRTPLGITPNQAFVRGVSDATLTQFQHLPHMRVRSRSAFTEMQNYIASRYAGVDVVHSFEDTSGQVFDCVPMEQQPALRGSGQQRIAKAPDLTPGQPTVSERAATPTVSHDRHGNIRQCPPGAIPLRRVTLEELIRFPDLRSFFRKHPGSTVLSAPPTSRPSQPDPDNRNNHRYAVGYQEVGNIGGHGFISLYAPTVDSNETFSLAQHWYSGGSDTNLQTVEVGWQVFPQHYGHANPVLFIFWTADDYQTGGAYNLESPGFVQINNNVLIGGARTPVSQVGGYQIEMEIAVWMNSDGWWIYIDGLSSDHALGYYPLSLFGSGAMASGADMIEFGGETVSGDPPSGDWGPMGSGQDASAGWTKAAYQRAISYYSADGNGHWATLNVDPNHVTSCYSFAGGFDSVGSWGTYFFFGGAGGGDC